MFVHLDGRLLPLAEARISPEDRGFLFADGIYEAVAAYRGRLFCWREHMARLRAGLEGLEIPFDDLGALERAARAVLDANAFGSADALVYLQVTRGAAPRGHAFPEPPPAPTVYVAARPLQRPTREQVARGVSAVTVPDLRWGRCDLKTTALVANVLAVQQARRQGAFEALLVRDGALLEGSHSSLFAVRGGALVTHPEGPRILPGVTRQLVLEDAERLGIPCHLEPLPLSDRPRLQELFLTGTSTEVMPVVAMDGHAVGAGTPGEVTLRLRQAFLERVAAAPAPDGR
jgi:D-alanine transaminase